MFLPVFEGHRHSSLYILRFLTKSKIVRPFAAAPLRQNLSLRTDFADFYFARL